MAIPRVFTIAASAPFLPTLIQTLIDGRLVAGFPAAADPLALASATIYLPTRRACRIAREIFLDAIKQDAAIPPRFVALGDVDEDEIAFAQAASGALAASALELPPALPAFERRMLIAQLVLKWASTIAPQENGEASLVANNPVSALALADDLARLMDDMTTRGVSWDRLDDLVPDNFDRYWQLTLEFLKIAREAWPKILAERGAIEAAEHRDALLKAEAARLSANPQAPVIAAGSTGSMPATAQLIATIAKLSGGAVVLPGLDMSLDEQSWQLMAGRHDPAARNLPPPAAGHPQFAMRALLSAIGIARDQVTVLGQPGARERLVSQALRPAESTDKWDALSARDLLHRDELEPLWVIEATGAEEEALAIAVALREAVEKNKSAALVTPDRALARRVIAALGRWNIAADDSGGDPLADTRAGRFARLAAETALAGARPAKLLALLKHPLLRLGSTPASLASAIAALEMATLRGPRPRAGTAGIAHALDGLRAELAKLRRKEPTELHWSDPRTELRENDLAGAADLIARVTAALAPLESLASTQPNAFTGIAARHYDVIAALSAAPDGEPLAFAGHDGVKLAQAFDDIAALPPDADLIIARADYADLFRAAVAQIMVRRPELPGVQVHIYGLLESRLQSCDRIVLGGLVEGVWPPETRPDPWLSRPMRHALGLDMPERRISLSAHDFAQALGVREVVLAYPARLGGAPTVISRFVQRLAAVMGDDAWKAAREGGAKYVAWARALDHSEEPARISRPEPKPPRAARPTSLSVTDVEDWLRDPYSIYARYILRLRELDPIDLEPGAADRGIVIHGALSEFTRTYAAALPADPAGALIEIGKRHFAALADYPEAQAFWWPRFERIAHWFAAWERTRRPKLKALHAEIPGKIEIPLGERTFTLRGRADRIEELRTGGHAILDYKTGQVPSDKQVGIGISPQLTLEAAMLRRGGFSEIGAASCVAELVYVSLKGGELIGEERPINFKNGNADSEAERALARFSEVVHRFDDEQQPYIPLVLSMWKNRYGSYDHLARVKEWAVPGEEEDVPGVSQ
jgi:ATP-dependent helicase/nuclease subunit B